MGCISSKAPVGKKDFKFALIQKNKEREKESTLNEACLLFLFVFFSSYAYVLLQPLAGTDWISGACRRTACCARVAEAYDIAAESYARQ